MLLHSGLLGLAHCLLYVEPLPFGCISSEDCELMQLKTVLESSPCSKNAFLWSLDNLLQPTSYNCSSCGRLNPIGTVCHQTGGSSEACTS